MADLPNTPGAPKKELTMEIRLLIAFLLMGLVLFVTPYIYKAPPPPKPLQPAKQAEKAAAPVKPAEATKPVAATAAVAALPVPGQIAATSEQLLTIDTQIYHIVLSNHGAVAQTWVLKKYKDHNGKPLDLVNPASFTKVPPPLSLALKDDQEANAINFGLYVAKPDSDGLGVQYEFSDGANYAKKSLRFTRNG